MLQGIALFGIIIVLYGALAGKLGRWSITAPMVFVAAGFLLGPAGLNLHQISLRTEGVKELTEITLALLLFADASTLSFRQVREDARLPLRLLTIGLLLTIALGFVTALGLLPGEAEVTESTENLGTFLSILVWGIFGALFLPLAFQATTNWRPIAYAILSLTVIRMAPVALALRGVGFRRDTVALMGWFGPRGLASVVFTLMAFLEFEQAGRPIDTLAAVATWTILLSVFAHGLSAVPLSAWYARRLAAAGQPLAETTAVSELPGRRKLLAGQAQAGKEAAHP